ncbi:PTS sugar transporter subunit IIB [Oceanobacillus sp. CFH 90083]|uniref:PTS sugar transporter subunit IIB n=1 Tax=Oceanobacillus sp. CFH 90083 TaxID=2592336 RepID=UPI00128E64DE|nr:PTS sugar transporter subunit IIB [Oceanobacillus sp. CFH 90083]
MQGIKLVRVDFRLIHGQVITKWRNKVSVNKIIVVNNALSEDEFMSDIYVMAAPPDMEVEVISEENFVRQAQAGEYDHGEILVLFKSIIDVLHVYRKGVHFESLQIGGLGSGNKRTSVVKGIAIDQDDADMLLEMQGEGTDVTFQVTPEEPKLKLDNAVKKLKK